MSRDACNTSQREARHAAGKLDILTGAHGVNVDVLDNPDAVHDVRVASRRARVYLAEFKDNLPDGLVRKTRKRLRKIGRKLGTARELDVCIAILREWPEVDASVREYVEERLVSDRTTAQTGVADIHTQLVDGTMANLFFTIRHDFQKSTSCHLRHARGRLRKRLEKAEELYAAWWTSRLDEDLHLVRIRMKTFRYAVEVYRRLYGKPADKFLHQLEAAQDALGRWNDLRVLRNRLQLMEADAPRNLRGGIGLLVAAISAEVDAAQERAREELGAFFEKKPMKEYNEIFGDWHCKCCHGAR